jgi:hypothetical protein
VDNLDANVFEFVIGISGHLIGDKVAPLSKGQVFVSLGLVSMAVYMI